MSNKAAKAYMQTQVVTTSQGQLLLLLYDGAIKFLNQAKEKIAVKDYAAKGILISKAIDIINELDSSINLEKGGSLAENLHKLYFYATTRLLLGNLRMDSSLLDEVIKILSGLRSAYAEIMDTPEAQAALAQIAASIPRSVGNTRAPTVNSSAPSMLPPKGVALTQSQVLAYAMSGQAMLETINKPKLAEPGASGASLAARVEAAKQAEAVAMANAQQTTTPEATEAPVASVTPVAEQSPATEQTSAPPATDVAGQSIPEASQMMAPSTGQQRRANTLYKKFSQS